MINCNEITNLNDNTIKFESIIATMHCEGTVELQVKLHAKCIKQNRCPAIYVPSYGCRSLDNWTKRVQISTIMIYRSTAMNH